MLAFQTIYAQGPTPADQDTALTHIPQAVLHDQKGLWTSPARVRARDLKWLLPLAGSVGWLLTTDKKNMRERIHTNTLARGRGLAVSNVSAGSLAAVPAFLYWWGWRHGDDYSQRTAVLTARAVADTVIATEVLRGITWRERPKDAAGPGRFSAANGLSSSFPSLHSSAAWAIASVVARRYPGWLTQAGVYGLASAVSLTRVTAREHFPSDVVAGSALGWLIGRYVSRPTSFQGPPAGLGPPQSSSEAAKPDAGATYVPMDSWIYAALDRLAALGLIPSQISGLRPWTRSECRRQTLEAEEKLQESDLGAEAADLVAALRRELDAPDSAAPSVTLHSVYMRNGVIAGPALNDSFHFGQTWINDNGRPFGRGWNSYTGFTASAESGRFFAYVNGEYQHAPGRDPYSLPVRQAISSLDGIPLQLAQPRSDTNRFRTLDAYAGVRFGDLEFSVGKQALWYGPSYDAPLSFSTNAEPTKNLRASTAHPIRLGRFGEVRGEVVMGKLGGQMYTWRPWFNALKISFKLTENLEMGFTRWSILWGVGHPITAHSLIKNLISTNSPRGATGVGATDPGDRKGGFDFRYRIPGLRNWLTFYTDSYCDDDPSPLAAPHRAAVSPGIYLARVPGIPRLDFRVEAPSTMPLGPDQGGDFIYANGQYLSGNTNYGNLLGSWAGRDGRAIEAWSTYWFSPRNKVELGFRRLKISTKLLPGGSTQSDGTLKASFALGRDWHAEAFVQYEKFYVPLLGPRRSNLSGWIQLTWEPNLQISGKRN
jgi:membrane-associated phospholipid phosphatase